MSSKHSGQDEDDKHNLRDRYHQGDNHCNDDGSSGSGDEDGNMTTATHWRDDPRIRATFEFVAECVREYSEAVEESDLSDISTEEVLSTAESLYAAHVVLGSAGEAPPSVTDTNSYYHPIVNSIATLERQESLSNRATDEFVVAAMKLVCAARRNRYPYAPDFTERSSLDGKEGSPDDNGSESGPDGTRPRRRLPTAAAELYSLDGPDMDFDGCVFAALGAFRGR